MTDWDKYYMYSSKLPVTTYEPVDTLADIRLYKVICIISNCLTTLVGINLTILLYIGWEWLHP